MRIAIAALLLLLPSCAARAADPLEITAYASVVADVVSTRYALNNGAEERNPLLGSDPSNGTLAISAAVRIASIYTFSRMQMPPRARRYVLLGLSCMTFGVAGNNVAVARGTDRGAAITIGCAIPFGVHLATDPDH